SLPRRIRPMGGRGRDVPSIHPSILNLEPLYKIKCIGSIIFINSPLVKPAQPVNTQTAKGGPEMIYGKLPVSFLMALASEKNGSTNSSIAQTLLENLDAVRVMGIRELAAFCHIAPSSVSRFCRELGCEGYAELREVL